jgi:hypothetical protein
MAALLLSFGLVLMGCDNGDKDDANTDPKTLVITGMSQQLHDQVEAGIYVALVSPKPSQMGAMLSPRQSWKMRNFLLQVILIL